MSHNVKLSIVFAVSLLLAQSAGRCDSKKPTDGAGKADTSAAGGAKGGQLKHTQRPSRVLYHGVHPGSADGDETTVEDLDAYVREVGREAAFVYISQELDEKWLKGEDEKNHPVFPAEQVRRIRERGAIPFIRLMTRKSPDTNEDKNLEDLYTYDVLIGDPKVKLAPKDEETRDKFRRRMLAWAEAAGHGDLPLFVEWGTEANGYWFWWNALWYADPPCQKRLRAGQAPDVACRERLVEGTNKFRRAFQSLRTLVNVEGKASNVKWIFHVAGASDPNPATEGNDWNSIEKYYPGAECPECVDAIGVSAYGPQRMSDGCGDSFQTQMGRLLTGEGSEEHDSLKRIGLLKKIFVLEFGHTLITGKEGRPNPKCDAAAWTRSALKAMFDAGNWPGFNIAGFSWWNESWPETASETASVTDMRLQHFDLCREVGAEEAKKVERVLPCDCWLKPGRRCYDLRARRGALRKSFKQTLDDHGDFLRTRPDETFLR
jgi:hypothetical protein